MMPTSRSSESGITFERSSLIALVKMECTADQQLVLRILSAKLIGIGVSQRYEQIFIQANDKQKTEHGKGDSKCIILIHKAPFHHTRTFILRIIGHVPAGRKQEILDDFLTGFSCYTYTLAQTSLTFAGDGDSN